MKIGYFFKNAVINDSEPVSYTNETIYETPADLVWAILEKNIKSFKEYKEYKSIYEDIILNLKNCKDSLSIIKQIKISLLDYKETCELFLDIGFTSIF